MGCVWLRALLCHCLLNQEWRQWMAKMKTLDLMVLPYSSLPQNNKVIRRGCVWIISRLSLWAIGKKACLTASQKTEGVLTWGWEVQCCVPMKAGQEEKGLYQDFSWEELLEWWWYCLGLSLINMNLQPDQPCTWAHGETHIKYSLMSTRDVAVLIPAWWAI